MGVVCVTNTSDDSKILLGDESNIFLSNKDTYHHADQATSYAGAQELLLRHLPQMKTFFFSLVSCPLSFLLYVVGLVLQFLRLLLSRLSRSRGDGGRVLLNDFGLRSDGGGMLLEVGADHANLGRIVCRLVSGRSLGVQQGRVRARLAR